MCSIGNFRSDREQKCGIEHMLSSAALLRQTHLICLLSTERPCCMAWRRISATWTSVNERSSTFGSCPGATTTSCRSTSSGPASTTPGGRISYGSFYNGIYRPRQFAGPAALSLVTAPPKERRDAPYDDEYDEVTGTFTYHYRRPQSDSARARMSAAADNRALKEALRLGVPLIYFRGIAAGQYTPVAPVFVTRDDPVREVVAFQAALPLADTTPAGLTSDELTRRYATYEAHIRLHQHRFRERVLRAYRTRCAVCTLREAPLLQAAHIIEDRDPRGAAAVVNGIALVRDPSSRLRPQPARDRSRRCRAHRESPARGDRRTDAARRAPGLSRKRDRAATRPARPPGSRASPCALRALQRRRVEALREHGTALTTRVWCSAVWPARPSGR